MSGMGGVAIAAARGPSEPNRFTMNFGPASGSFTGGKALSRETAELMTRRCREPKSLGEQVETKALARVIVPMATSFQVSRRSLCFSSSGRVENFSSWRR